MLSENCSLLGTNNVHRQIPMHVFVPNGGYCLQLFRESLSYKQGKAYTTISKVIMVNGGFYGCLSEPHGVSVLWKEAAQTRILFFLVPCH